MCALSGDGGLQVIRPVKLGLVVRDLDFLSMAPGRVLKRAVILFGLVWFFNSRVYFQGSVSHSFP